MIKKQLLKLLAVRSILEKMLIRRRGIKIVDLINGKVIMQKKEKKNCRVLF